MMSAYVEIIQPQQGTTQPSLQRPPRWINNYAANLPLGQNVEVSGRAVALAPWDYTFVRVTSPWT